jgi:hypothetical protein
MLPLFLRSVAGRREHKTVEMQRGHAIDAKRKTASGLNPHPPPAVRVGRHLDFDRHPGCVDHGIIPFSDFRSQILTSAL